MKTPVLVGTAVLGLLLGLSVPALAHGHEDDHHGGPQHHGNEGRHEDHHPGPPQRHEADYHHDAHPVQRVYDHHPAPAPQYRPASEHEYHHVPQPPYHSRDVWTRERSQHWEHEHHTWHERGGYVGYRIPPPEFHEHFGRAHCFRVHSVPVVVVDGRPRFHYSGVWVSVVDPVPETWAVSWYQTDDVYVDYINDGYYLCNRAHPGLHIAVNLSF